MKNILITLSLLIPVNILSMHYVPDCIPSCCREAYGAYTDRYQAHRYLNRPELTLDQKNKQLSAQVDKAYICGGVTCIACLATSSCGEAVCYGCCALNMYLMAYFIAKGTQELCAEGFKECIARKYGLSVLNKKNN